MKMCRQNNGNLILAGMVNQEHLPNNYGYSLILATVGGVVAIAICRNHEIGIDVEKIVDDKMLLDLAFRYFSPSEYADICAHGQSQIVRFFEYWTLKESFSKANGAGLYIPLNLFNFSIGVSSYDNRINRNIQTTQKGSNIAFRVGRIGW